MKEHRWTFNYTIKFLMKDNKCRLVIEDVYYLNMGIDKIQLFNAILYIKILENDILLTTSL